MVISIPDELQVELKTLAGEIATPGVDPTAFVEDQLLVIDEALQLLISNEDWQGVLWLRQLFNPLIARDTAIGIPQLQRVEEKAIEVARQLDDPAVLASFLEERGRNLHKQGYHQQAIEYFEEASEQYKAAGQQFLSLRSYFMTATCHRPLGRTQLAEHIIDNVLEQVALDNPWRGEPIHAKALLRRDEGKLDEAEDLIWQAIDFYRKQSPDNSVEEQLTDQTSVSTPWELAHDSADILISGALADLGEIKGLQGQPSEAKKFFEHSLQILAKYQGQYKRHQARTRLKLAEVLTFEGKYAETLKLLHITNDELCAFDESAQGPGRYYDWLWRTELLEALIYFRTGYLNKSFKKLRVALMYRRELGLSTTYLLRQLLKRLCSTLSYTAQQSQT
jgi:tetratricopeptide (TPR) repeat protein